MLPGSSQVAGERSESQPTGLSLRDKKGRPHLDISTSVPWKNWHIPSSSINPPTTASARAAAPNIRFYDRQPAPCCAAHGQEPAELNALFFVDENGRKGKEKPANLLRLRAL